VGATRITPTVFPVGFIPVTLSSDPMSPYPSGISEKQAEGGGDGGQPGGWTGETERQRRETKNSFIIISLVVWPVWPPRTIKCNNDNYGNNNNDNIIMIM
jgi:hypothetical protein